MPRQLQLRNTLVFAVLCVAVVASASCAAAQPYQVLAGFAGSGSSVGASGLIQAQDGYLYGTTQVGGAFNLGAVFRVDHAGKMVTLYSFSGTLQGGAGNPHLGSDGAWPARGVIQTPDGNFYGTTGAGGEANFGAVFEMTPSGVVRVIQSFLPPDGGGTYLGLGSYSGLLKASDGNLYGTSWVFGVPALTFGTVFKVGAVGPALHYFLSMTDGSPNLGSLIQGRDGSLYGMTQDVGEIGFGAVPFGPNTIYKITLAGAISLLYTFPPDVSGVDWPMGSLLEASDGALYGVTRGADGLSENWGSIFKLDAAGQLTNLHSFGMPGQRMAPATAASCFDCCRKQDSLSSPERRRQPRSTLSSRRLSGCDLRIAMVKSLLA